MQNPLQTEWCRNFLARNWGKLWLVQAAVLILLGMVIAGSLQTPAPHPVETAGESHTQHAEAPTIWTCSMHPQIRRDGPDKCPLCGMELVPVTTSAGGMRTISISPTARELMRIEVTPVQRRFVTAEVRMVGKVEYDETRLAHITARVSGRLDRLFVDYTGIEVQQGDHLVDIYSEELYAAQEELIQALKYRRDRSPNTTRITPIDLVASAREKLRLLGLTAEQIQGIERQRTSSDHMTVYSPIGGIVIDKLRQQGDRVRTGDRIYTVADLKQVWVKLDAYESDLQWLRYGQEVEFATEAYPGEKFIARIAFIDPVLNKDTRTVKVRVNVPNINGRLKPEMFVRAVVRSRVATGGRVLDAALAGKWISPMHPEIVKDEPGVCDICGMPLVRAETLGYVAAAADDASKPLVIPVSAALVTGKRAIVYVEDPTADQPTFDGREIVLGPRAGEYYLVRHGLTEGELVVTNGNFKLDSALQISAKPSMMTPDGGGGGRHDHGGHAGDKKPQQNQNPRDQLVLSSQLRAQLGQVIEAYDQVKSAFATSDVSQVRVAFMGLSQATERVDQARLKGHAAMLWREFSMLLHNDAIVGADAAALEDVAAVYPILTRHIERVRESFDLSGGSTEGPLLQLAVPKTFQDQLARLWKIYPSLGQALAEDDLAAAKQFVPQLLPVINSVDASRLQGNAATAWQRERDNFVTITSKLNEGADIDAVRAGFALLSDEMITLMKSFGVSDVGPIYELHCPMAFGGRGARWLQSNDQVRNPYFGATMLKCADRVTLILPTENGPTSPVEHRHDAETP